MNLQNTMNSYLTAKIKFIKIGDNMAETISGIIILITFAILIVLGIIAVDKQDKEMKKYRQEKLNTLARIAHAVEHNTDTLMHMLMLENEKNSTDNSK